MVLVSVCVSECVGLCIFFPGTISEQHDSVILTQMFNRHKKEHEKEKERI